MVLRVLGPLEICTPEGAPIALVGMRQRRLLAALAVGAGRVQGANALIAAVWPDVLPASPIAALHSQIARVRPVLRQAGIGLRTVAPGYVLDVTPNRVDALAFEETVKRAHRAADPAEAAEYLVASLQYWRGEAYEEFGDTEVLRGESARLREIRCLVRDEAVEFLAVAGRYAEAVSLGRQTCAENPLRESSRVVLMEALTAAGRLSEASTEFHAYRRLLDERLGLLPSERMRAAHLDVLRHSDTPSGRSRRPIPEQVMQDTGVRRTADPAGPERELVVLRTAVESATPLVILHEPAGNGPSALLTAFSGLTDGPFCRIDARHVTPTRTGLLQALAAQLGTVPELPAITDALERLGPRTVLAIDASEPLTRLDGWLRSTLLPALPTSTTVVLAVADHRAGSGR